MFSSTCTFDYLPIDPRPIKDDLKRVYFHPLENFYMVRNWRKVLHQLNIQPPEGQVEYRYLRAYKNRALGPPGRISVWEEAKGWVEEEDRDWNLMQPKQRKRIRAAYGRFPLQNASANGRRGVSVC